MTVRYWAGAALAVCALMLAAPSFSQNGQIFVGAPVSSVNRAGPPDKALENRVIVRDREHQAALNANVARILAPTFELAGDVTVVEGTGERPGMFKGAAILSVPVRFRATATLDADVTLGKIVVAKGTVLHRRTLLQQRGATNGGADWCGIGWLKFDQGSSPRYVCFPDGESAIGPYAYVASDITGEGVPLFNFSRLMSGTNATLTEYPEPAARMTSAAEAPASLIAELVAFSAEKGNGTVPWARGSSFAWIVRTDKAWAALDYSNASWDTVASIQGDHQVLRMAWIDLVFTRAGDRLNYEGYVDLAAEDPKLTTATKTYDEGLAGLPLQTSNEWSLGALDFDQDSLSLDAGAAAAGEVSLRLKGHIRQKVRLLEKLDFAQLGHFEAGDVFYAMTFEGLHHGSPFKHPGWCGTVHKHMMVSIIGPKDFTCFSTEQPSTTGVAQGYKDKWEMMWDGDLVRTGGEYPYFLPLYEVLPRGPEDDRDVYLRVKRDKKDRKKVRISLGIKDAKGEREQQYWIINLNSAGLVYFDIWTRRLRIEADGERGLRVAVEDGGGGLGLRVRHVKP